LENPSNKESIANDVDDDIDDVTYDNDDVNDEIEEDEDEDENEEGINNKLIIDFVHCYLCNQVICYMYLNIAKKI